MTFFSQRNRTYLSNSSRRDVSFRVDILVYAKEIRGIVFLLDSGQAG